MVWARRGAPALRRAHRRRRHRDAQPLYGEGLDAGRAALAAHRQPRRHARRRDDDPLDRGELMKTAKVNGTEIHYEMHGTQGSSWLILSHSLACSVRMWDPQVAHAHAAGERVAEDQPG